MKMRGDKAVARTLLIFSIATVVLAAPAVVRQRGSYGKSTDGSSTPSVASDSGYLPDNDASANRLLSSPDHPPYLSEDYDSSSTIHSSTEFGTDRYYSDQLSSSHFNSIHESDLSSDSSPGFAPESVYYDRPPGSEASEPHEDLPSTLGTQPSQDNPSPALDAAQSHDHPPSDPEAAQLHDHPPSGPEAAQLHDDSRPWWHDRWQPVTEIEQAVPDHDDHVDDELKSKGLCSLFSCLDWHFRWPFKRSPERDHGHRFSWH